MPVYAAIALITFMSSAGLPGLNGFVGEFTILLGTARTSVGFAVLATVGIIFAAWYLLWAFAKIFKGPSNSPANAELKDLSLREVVIMVPLVIMFIVIGLFPNLLLSKVNPSVDALLVQVMNPPVVRQVDDNQAASAALLVEK
jgi:NADH-quinone oxidoreductase subunit M